MEYKEKSIQELVPHIVSWQMLAVIFVTIHNLGKLDFTLPEEKLVDQYQPGVAFFNAPSRHTLSFSTENWQQQAKDYLLNTSLTILHHPALIKLQRTPLPTYHDSFQ